MLRDAEGLRQSRAAVFTAREGASEACNNRKQFIGKGSDREVPGPFFFGIYDLLLKI